jgi:hypothetical protein
MKWIIVSIVLFIVGYTLVNLFFRKPNQPYRPYQDAQDRATTARLLAAGWHKMHLSDRRPLEKAALSDLAPVGRGAAGLGPDLEPNFAEEPKLAASIDRVTAPATVAHGSDYSFYFTASLADQHLQFGELTLYRRGNELALIPTIEDLPGKQLMTRWNDADFAATWSTADLPPGRYEARIVARGAAATWSFTIK